MSRTILKALIAAAAAAAVIAPPALADSVSEVEGARAKERGGYYINDEEADQLDRYGGNDDRYYRGYGPGYGYGGYGGYGYDDGPGAYVYIGPGYGHHHHGHYYDD